MSDKLTIFQQKSGALLMVSNELLVFLFGRLAIEHPNNTMHTNPVEAISFLLSNAEISKISSFRWPKNKSIFFDINGHIRKDIPLDHVDLSTVVEILQKIVIPQFINTCLGTNNSKNPKCIKENHLRNTPVIVNGKCKTCGLPEIIVYLLIGVEIIHKMRNILEHSTKDELELSCTKTLKFSDFPSCKNEQDIYNEIKKAFQYILEFLADGKYFPKLKGISIEKTVEYKYRLKQIITDTGEEKILDLRTPEPLPRIDITVGNKKLYLFEDMMEKRSLKIQHVPDGFFVYFDNTDVDEIYLLQKKSSDKNEWEDIPQKMEEIENYKKFELCGENANSHIDIRMITTRITQNDDQPYLILTAFKQKVHDDEALRHRTVDRTFSKVQVHCHSFGDTITAHTLLKEQSFRSLVLDYEVNVKAGGCYENLVLTKIAKNYLQCYYRGNKLISFPRTYRFSPPQNDFEHVFKLIEDAYKKISTTDDYVVIFGQLDLYNILEILNISQKQFHINKTNASRNLIIFNAMINTILLINVTEKTNIVDINKALKGVNDDVKSLLVLIRNFLCKHTLSVKGMLVTTSLDKPQLHRLMNCEDCKETDMHLTREELNHKDIVRKFQKISTELKKCLGETFESNKKFIIELSNVVAASMACRRLDLPLPVGTVHQKIESIQLTYEQLEIIYSPENHKIIRGPFGSGKTILGKELVKIQNDACERDGGVLYFVTMDAHTLLHIKIEQFCESINSKKLICKNILEISEESGADKMLNLPQLLQYLSTKHKEEAVNVILDEYDSEELNEEQAQEVKTLLKQIYANKKVTVIVQSIEKTRTTKDDSSETTHQSHCFKQTGMKIFNLSKTLRYSVSINDAVSSSQSEITQRKSIGRIQRMETKSDRLVNTTNASQPNPPKQASKISISQAKGTSTLTESKERVGASVNTMTTQETPNVKKLLQTKPDKLVKASHEKNASTIIESSFKFFDQNPGHMIVGKKPRILRLDTKGAQSSSALCYFLEYVCFQEWEEKKLIICNTERYYNCIIQALQKCGLSPLSYMTATQMLPCLSTDEKKDLYKEWEECKSVLVTDSAGCRGLEEEKVVLVMDESEHHERHLFVESACRSTSDLYIVSFKCHEEGDREKHSMNKFKRWFKSHKKKDQGSIEGKLSEVFDTLIKQGSLVDLTKRCFSNNINYTPFDILDLPNELSTNIKNLEEIYPQYMSSPLHPTKNAGFELTKEELRHTWTSTELWNLIYETQFDKLNAILLSLSRLSDEQKRYVILLHTASRYHAPIRTIELLHEKGCGLWERDGTNSLPIHWAAINNHYEAVKWMLDKDIKLLNVQDEDEDTPLHRAAKRNHKEMVELLLVNDADVNAKNNKGKKADELDNVNDEIKAMIRKYRQ